MIIIVTRKDIHPAWQNMPIEDLKFSHFKYVTREMVLLCNKFIFQDDNGQINILKNRWGYSGIRPLKTFEDVAKLVFDIVENATPNKE